MLYSAPSALWILQKRAPKYCVVVVLKSLALRRSDGRRLKESPTIQPDKYNLLQTYILHAKLTLTTYVPKHNLRIDTLSYIASVYDEFLFCHALFA